MQLLMLLLEWVASPCQQPCRLPDSGMMNSVINDELSGHVGCHLQLSLIRE